MKKLIVIFFAFIALSLSINAQVLVKSISSIKRAPREGTFYLKDGFFDREPVLLDCASFLFGLTFNLSGDKDFFQLYQAECYQAYHDIKEWTTNSQRVCLKANFESWDWSLEKQIGACEAPAY
jgi:hypothetical protein